MTRISDLETKITQANRAYYNDDPVISDEEFDALKDELKDLDPTNQALFAVGAPVEKTPWEKQKHKIPMSSQDKVNTIGELQKWTKDRKVAGELCWQEKLDGISLSLNYEDGLLVSAVTRGNGVIGENIYRNVVKMQGVPTELPKGSDYSGSIRGEVVMFKDAWEEHFPDKSNPRNAASGIARRLTEGGQEHLTVIAYDMTNTPVSKESAKLSLLKTMGFNIPGCGTGDIKAVDQTYQEYEASVRNGLPYEIDGLVIKVNDLEVQKDLGYHSDDETHNPKGQVALKFANEMRESKVEDVTWEVGLTGRLTPLGHITPVHIAGVLVSKASLQNWATIQKVGVRIGSRCLVSRRNDVIPYIEKALDSGTSDITPPTECPKCDEPVVWNGQYLQCENDECRVSGNIQKWVNLLEMDGIGPKVIEALVEAELVTTPADLYRLTAKQVETLDRMAERSAEKVVEAIQDKKVASFPVFMAGLNIPTCGRRVFKNFVAQGYDEVEDLFALPRSGMERIPGIGESKARDIYAGIRKRKALIDDLLSVGVEIAKADAGPTGGKLAGKSFCFTGKMDTPRGELEKRAEAEGATIRSVSKELTYLVIADPNSSSSKAVKARKLGVRLISEQEFETIIG